MSVQSKDEDRLRVLNRLYELTDGEEYASVDYREIAQQLGMPETRAHAAAQYLFREGLADWTAMGGMLGITHFGVKEVEGALRDPSRATDHFPVSVVQNVIQVENVYNSPIQQGSHGSTQSVMLGMPQADVLEELGQVIAQLMDAVERQELSLSVKTEVDADLRAAALQLKKSRPNIGILRTLGDSALQAIIRGGVSGAMPELLEQFRHLLSLLGS